MVQKQHRKSNAKKRPHVKKQGKQADNTQFRAQLDALGQKIVQVTADGNCFFMALADQLEGNEDEHGRCRSMVVQYILEEAGHYSYSYCSSLQGDKLLAKHISYHDEEHYNSVRLKEDTGDGPARPITIKTNSNLSLSSCQSKAGSNKSKSGAGKDITDAGSIKLVMAGSGCENIEKVEQVMSSLLLLALLQIYGDVDATMEYLIAEKGIEDFSKETVQSPCDQMLFMVMAGDDANGNSEEQREKPVEETNKENPPSNSSKRTHDDGSAQREDKKIPRNKACPCGSKKKYKSCCESGTGKVSAISNTEDFSLFMSKFCFAVIKLLNLDKIERKKKQGKRGSDTSALYSGSNGGPPDMGALCI
ncbi:hypothetical protein ACJRO7_031082 [Eucalyptus globulus]|uniref:OTU domain-containing protein n=1 Tax=Eucalyptus globulus TaxID=34317 RepID=A0ABD3JGY7_EUCGL